MLLLVSMVSYIDRSILNTIGQSVKADLKLSDLQLGLLGGLAFAVVNGVLGIPLARLADRRGRVLIISCCLAAWSAITMLCGLAQNFAQIFLARVGVGIGEAGGNAPAHSLIASYFPPDRRARALSIYVLGVPLGIFVGATLSGWVDEHYGWRAAFVVAGAPGIVLAVIFALTVREPRDGPAIVLPTSKLGDVFRSVIADRPLRHLILGGTVMNFAAYAIVQFLHPYFIRHFGLAPSPAATWFALLNSIPNTFGFLLGGFLADRLARRSERFYGLIPAIAMATAALFYTAAFLQSDFAATLLLLTVPTLTASMYFAPTYAALQNRVSDSMRTTAAALAMLCMNVLGAAAGPAFAGWLSDVFASRALDDYAALCGGTMPIDASRCAAASADGLQMALLISGLFYFWSSAHFLIAAFRFPPGAPLGVAPFRAPSN